VFSCDSQEDAGGIHLLRKKKEETATKKHRIAIEN